jgi:hypothetical protein
MHLEDLEPQEAALHVRRGLLLPLDVDDIPPAEPCVEPDFELVQPVQEPVGASPVTSVDRYSSVAGYSGEDEWSASDYGET